MLRKLFMLIGLIWLIKRIRRGSGDPSETA